MIFTFEAIFRKESSLEAFSRFYVFELFIGAQELRVVWIDAEYLDYCLSLEMPLRKEVTAKFALSCRCRACIHPTLSSSNHLNTMLRIFVKRNQCRKKGNLQRNEYMPDADLPSL